MSSLKAVLAKDKQLRVAGIDDAPFAKVPLSPVNFSVVVCSNTRFEGMLWGQVLKDGDDATEQLIDAIKHSKFYAQLHAVLIDGIALGGFNVIDLPMLQRELDLPCIAVMRKAPDMVAIYSALDNVPNPERKKQLIKQAGEIYQRDGFVFQAAGCEPDDAALLLHRVTDVGVVPEALRLAHLIGSAIKTGESGKRA